MSRPLLGGALLILFAIGLATYDSYLGLFHGPFLGDSVENLPVPRARVAASRAPNLQFDSTLTSARRLSRVDFHVALNWIESDVATVCAQRSLDGR